ncbi:unnamed protein product [Coregonus sp. 'balchen']|nr:unnamed protein product [Coregonus sp. 'balchen']
MQARSAEVPELSAEPLLRSCSSTASMKVKNVKKLSFTKGHFPKLAECAHFHYENVDFGTIQVIRHLAGHCGAAMFSKNVGPSGLVCCGGG